MYTEEINDKWNILIVDDEEEVHSVTKLVLMDYEFDHRPLNFISAYSGKEAKQILSNQENIALILLDVVMETDHSGLELVEWIRKDLDNQKTRIILRTGQPGKAPETDVIMSYDINDYKGKTELTTQKLFTTVTASLRSFRDLSIIEITKQGLEAILDSTRSLYEAESFKSFAAGALEELTAILDLNLITSPKSTKGVAIKKIGEQFTILAGAGAYSEAANLPIEEYFPSDICNNIRKTYESKTSTFIDNYYFGFFQTDDGMENILFLEGFDSFSRIKENLLKVFTQNVNSAFNTLHQRHTLLSVYEKALEHLINSFSTLMIGKPSGQILTGYLAAYIGRLCDLEEGDITDLLLAASLYKIDNITALPESQINEAAIIAQQIGEHWDGNGSDSSLKGTEIHLFSRITSIAVYLDQALSTRKNLNTISSLISKNSGRQWDPDICRIVINQLHSIKEYYETLKIHPGIDVES